MTDQQPGGVEFDIKTLAVTEDGEPTPEIRALLAEEGWTIWPTAKLSVPQLLPELPELQELTVSVPLLEHARDNVGKKVVAWIAGGIRVEGRLTDLDDEQLVATIDDNNDRYLVDLQAVAVLQVAR
jgi:hypothetical protein